MDYSRKGRDIMSNESLKAYKQMINDLWESVGEKEDD